MHLFDRFPWAFLSNKVNLSLYNMVHSLKLAKVTIFLLAIHAQFVPPSLQSIEIYRGESNIGDSIEQVPIDFNCEFKPLRTQTQIIYDIDMPLPGEPPVEHLIQIKNDLQTIAVDTGAFESRCILSYEITYDENSPRPEEGEIKIARSKGVWRNKPDDSIVFIPTKKNTFIFALEARLTHPETGEETVKKLKGITLIASACRVNYIEPPASLNFNLRRGQKRVRIPEFESIVPDCPVVAYSLQSYLEP